MQFLLQETYTAEAWKRLIDNPEDRVQASRPVVERLGGSIRAAWLALGDFDVVAVVDLPDIVSAAALSMAFAAGGSFRSITITPLLSIDEAVEAMRCAQGSGYHPPGAPS